MEQNKTKKIEDAFNEKLLSYILLLFFIKNRESTSVVAKSVPPQQLCFLCRANYKNIACMSC